VTLGAAAVVLALDQTTKELALTRLTDGPVHVVGPFSFELEFNRGVAFSLGSGLGTPVLALVVVVIGAVLVLARHAEGRLAALGIGMVLGGALGNLADRLFRSGGAVIDFIHTSFWPTFNVADSAVVIGSVLLALALWRREPTEVGPGPAAEAGR
jgi:signal peptidase II